jgi:hypothetical protein
MPATRAERKRPSSRDENTSSKKKQKLEAAKSVPPPLTSLLRQDVDFRKIQVVPMSVGSTVRAPWIPVFNVVVERMNQLSKVASSFFNFFLAIALLLPPEEGIHPSLPSLPDSFFSAKLFEHIFKAATFDASVKFQPILQYARCVWFHAQIVDSLLLDGQPPPVPLDRCALWKEIMSVAADSKKAARPIQDPILHHPALAELLPSCKALDQCIKYEASSYFTAFKQYQVTGFRAHLRWYLLHRYDIATKKAANRWIEQHLLLVTVKDSEEGENEAEEEKEEEEVGANENESFVQADEIEEDDEPLAEKNKNVTRLPWSDEAQALESERLKSLSSGKGNHWTRIVGLHHALLQALQVSAGEDSTKPPPKLFTLTPVTSFARRFVRIDVQVLRAFAKLVSSSDSIESIESIEDVLVARKLRRGRRGGQRTLAPTCATNGVEIHVQWQTRVTLSCQVDPKKKAAYESRQQAKAEDIVAALATGQEIDGRRTKVQPLPILSGNGGPIYRKKTARLEDFASGIFQSWSILASSDAFLLKQQQQQQQPVQASSSIMEDLSLLPFAIKSIDPGRTNIISSASWNRQTQRWERGVVLSNRHYYNQLGHRPYQTRAARRLSYHTQRQAGAVAPELLLHPLLEQDRVAANVSRHLAFMSLHSLKTTCPVQCLTSLVHTVRCWKDMHSFYGSRNTARERFTVAQRKQRTVANLIEQLVPAAEAATTIIVLGSARFACTSKGAQATPVGYLVSELAKVRRVVLVDEYYTSQMCSGCNLSGVGSASSALPADAGCIHKQHPLRDLSGLVNQNHTTTAKSAAKNHPTLPMATFRRTSEPAREQKRNKARLASQARVNFFPPRPGRRWHSNKIRGLLQCRHCGTYWDRDFVAACNIGWVFIGLWVAGERPAHLRRPLKSSPTAETLALVLTLSSPNLSIPPPAVMVDVPAMSDSILTPFRHADDHFNHSDVVMIDGLDEEGGIIIAPYRKHYS